MDSTTPSPENRVGRARDDGRPIDYAKVYDRQWSGVFGEDIWEYGPISLHCFRIVRNYLAQLTPTSILDVGCGNGSNLKRLSRLYPKSELMGTDVSEKALDQARLRGVRCPLRVLDLENQSPEIYAEVVICQNVLEHLRDDERGMMHLARMGKWAIISVPAGSGLSTWDVESKHFRVYTLDLLTEKLERNGFSVVAAKPF